jgi:hypothetical protein
MSSTLRVETVLRRNTWSSIYNIVEGKKMEHNKVTVS